MATISPSPSATPVPPFLSPPPTQSSSPPQGNTTSPSAAPPAQPPPSLPPPASTSPLPSLPPPASTSPPPQSADPPPPSSPPPVIAPSPPSTSQPLPSIPPSSPPPSLQPPPSSIPPISPPQLPSPAPPAGSPPPPSSVPQPESPPPPSTTPPISVPPPPPTSPSPPPPTATPPIGSPPPRARQSPPPPTSPSPPPAQSGNAPPPPSTNPPESSRPSSQPPRTSPPPPTSNPPGRSPPSPVSNPPRNSPPPQALSPPGRSPPPQALSPPGRSTPPPVSAPPSNSPPPPVLGPPIGTPPPLPPPSNSNFTPGALPPSPVIRPTPPLSGGSPVSPTPPPPSLVRSGDSPSNTSNTDTSGASRSNGTLGIGTGAVVAIALVFGLLFFGFVGTATWCIWKRKKKDSELNGGYSLPTSSPKSDSGLLKMGTSVVNRGTSSGSDAIYSPQEPGGLGNSRSWFTYEELADATNGFSAQNLLGKGGFGTVYKGRLVDGRDVAVKQLKLGGGQGEREFRAEVDIISRIHHRHLVSLVGYCISENSRMLVYDYVPNNTLHFHLHGEGRPVMDWATRLKIAVGATRGIAYLHEDCHPRIIHRDIKSSNILLDNSFEARVSDFGLAKLFEDTNTHVTTRVMGTFGYMAPEYATSGKLTEKSDVFSFGVVLLELITGRKPVDVSQPLGEESLVEWARPLLSNALETHKFDELVDPMLEKNFVDSQMFRMIEVAAACVRHSSAKRPQMGQVLRAFDTAATSDLNNGMRVGESEIFNTAQQSAEIRLFQRMAFGNQDYSTEFFSQR